MKEYHVYFANKKEKAMLEEYMFGAKAKSKSCSLAKLNADIVGRPVQFIAEQAGFKVPENVRSSLSNVIQ